MWYLWTFSFGEFFLFFLFFPSSLLHMVFFCVDILYAISFCSVYILTLSNSPFLLLLRLLRIERILGYSYLQALLLLSFSYTLAIHDGTHTPFQPSEILILVFIERRFQLLTLYFSTFIHAVLGFFLFSC